jgi:hypothetical protein
MQAFREAADGIRTHDLLHGKQNVRSRASQESPGKEGFPSNRGSAMLPSFYREIAGVPGLKPDWGCRESLGGRFPRMAFWGPEVEWHERDVVVPAFRQWLEAQGWETETETEFVDVVAHRGNETIYAEAKGRTNSRPGAGLDTL